MQSKITSTKKTPSYSLGEEIANCISHGLGAAFSIVALVAMIVTAAQTGEAIRVFCATVFGAGMVMLYTMSTLYHALRGRAKVIMRVFDHCSIYILIAATYTPYALIMLPKEYGTWLIIAIWACAATGITLTAVNLEKFKKFGMFCYIGMGWSVLITIEPLLNAIDINGIILMIIGGVAYMLGLIFYGMKKWKYMHSIWHLFVLGGTVAHFFSIWLYILPK